LTTQTDYNAACPPALRSRVAKGIPKLHVCNETAAQRVARVARNTTRIRQMKRLLKSIFFLFSWIRMSDSFLLLPFEKRSRLAAIACHFGADTFVETGSYHGETSSFMAGVVKQVYSIEVDPKNAEVARQNCTIHPNVQILTGPSERVLPTVIDKLEGRVLFFLDAHYQTGMLRGKTKCPLFDELESILSKQHLDCVILIDDARKYIWINGWPSLASIEKLVARLSVGMSMRISHDMICIGHFSM
jgi:hypothetical protein